MDITSGFKAKFKLAEKSKTVDVLAADHAGAARLIAARFPGASDIKTEEIDAKKLPHKVSRDLYYLANSDKNEAAKKQATKKVEAYSANSQILKQALENQAPQLLSELVKALFDKIMANGH